jgi:8-oxo-dGTP diphosphatase
MKIQLAGCVIVDDYDRMLLLHRYRDQQTQWELPGGKVEEGELAESAAVRELEEELGVQVQLVKTLGSGFFEEDENEYSFNWFQAKIISGEPTIKEPDIFDDFDYFALDDLMELSLSANMQLLEEKFWSGEVAL